MFQLAQLLRLRLRLTFSASRCKYSPLSGCNRSLSSSRDRLLSPSRTCLRDFFARVSFSSPLLPCGRHSSHDKLSPPRKPVLSSSRGLRVAIGEHSSPRRPAQSTLIGVLTVLPCPHNTRTALWRPNLPPWVQWYGDGEEEKTVREEDRDRSRLESDKYLHREAEKVNRN